MKFKFKIQPYQTEAVEHTVNRPIVIMDEPQKMEGEATEKVQYHKVTSYQDLLDEMGHIR